MPVDTQRLRQITDQCVLCGMCAPQCPTYTKTSHEAESPRGRIALMQAILSERLPADEVALAHLDNCLTCRNCERICPSGVAYGELIDGMRGWLRQQGRAASPLQQQLLQTVASPTRLRLGSTLMKASLGKGFGLMMKWLGQPNSRYRDGWQQLLRATPARQPWRASYPAQGTAKGRVALFTGCIADVHDQVSLRDAVTLLQYSGFEVVVPAGQGCCGALHYHAGDQQAARGLAEANLRAFADPSLDAVIGLASGCTSHLLHTPQWLRDHPDAAAFGARMVDIHAFLLRHATLSQDDFLPFAHTVAVHEPCSLRNGLRQERLPYQLLGLIPELTLQPLANNTQCCGAAGSYMLEHADIADELLADKLQAIAHCAPALVISSNIGCALHLSAGLRHEGNPLEVIHPVSLLARQLRAR